MSCRNNSLKISEYSLSYLSANMPRNFIPADVFSFTEFYCKSYKVQGISVKYTEETMWIIKHILGKINSICLS